MYQIGSKMVQLGCNLPQLRRNRTPFCAPGGCQKSAKVDLGAQRPPACLPRAPGPLRSSQNVKKLLRKLLHKEASKEASKGGPYRAHVPIQRKFYMKRTVTQNIDKCQPHLSCWPTCMTKTHDKILVKSSRPGHLLTDISLSVHHTTVHGHARVHASIYIYIIF